MNTRTLVLTALLILSFAPMAFAAGLASKGGLNATCYDPSDCLSNNCVGASTFTAGACGPATAPAVAPVVSPVPAAASASSVSTSNSVPVCTLDVSSMGKPCTTSSGALGICNQYGLCAVSVHTIGSSCTGNSGTIGVCAPTGQCSANGTSNIEDGTSGCGTTGYECCTAAVVTCTGVTTGSAGTCAESGSCGNNKINTTQDGAPPVCLSGNVCCVAPAAPTKDMATQPPVKDMATQPITTTNVTLINPLAGVNCNSGASNGNCLVAFLTNILQFVITIGAIVVTLMVVWVGYKFVVAQGNSEKISEARNMLLWTVIGALVLLGAQAISLGIQATVTALTSGS
jgi:hypothetical protein